MRLAQLPSRTHFSLPSSVNNNDNNNKGPLQRPFKCLSSNDNNKHKSVNPGRRKSIGKPVSKPGARGVSETSGIFVINDSLRKELLKIPGIVRPSGHNSNQDLVQVPAAPPVIAAHQVPFIPPPPISLPEKADVFVPPGIVVAVRTEFPRFHQEYQDCSQAKEFSTNSLSPCGNIVEEPPPMSLIEQKRQQWAKEREELHGLWSPWGKANNANNALDPTNMNIPKSSAYSSHNIDNSNMKQATSSGATVVTASYVAGLGLSTKASSSLAYPHNDVYLPPISGAEQSAPGGTGRRSTATTTTTSWAITASNNNQDMLRKSSLPNRMQSSAYTSQSQANLRRESHPVGQYHQPYHHSHISEEHSPPMGEWNKTSSRRGSVGGTDNYAVYRTDEEYNNINNSRRYMGDTEDYNITMERGSGRSPGRVIVHKIYMERGDSEEMNERMSRSLIMEPSSLSPNVVGPGGDNNMTNMQQREFGGSMGYIGLGKPPAAAMRSSLTIGLDPSYAQSLEIIEKQEKQKWLAELEQQREEQRVRKLMEKDDKRARWGDRGIGVGHFWDPSDSATSRLPASSSPYHNPQHGNLDEGNQQQNFSPSPPPWLERSLERMVTSKSLTNLNGDGNENTGDIQPYIGGPETTNRFINHSSSDLRNMNGEGGNNEEKSFARGHNSLLDPDIQSEMEKKRQANAEHLEALKKQMEEKRMRQEEEKQRQLKEERDHEERIAKQNELELRRLEREKRKENGWPSISDLDDLYQSAMNNQVQMANDSMTEEDFPKHESPLIPHQVEEGLPDAYELEIARRQSLLLGQKSSVENAGEFVQGASSMVDLRHDGKMVDQCLMTDSDHIYERTLTPTTERKRSASLGRSEFGTQTEQEEFSSGGGENQRGARKSRGGSKSKTEEKAKDEKPRWGANPVKKQYLKQSEKDPYYMQRLRKRNQRTRQGDFTGTDDSEGSHSGQQRSTEPSQPVSQANNIPFSRIRSRKLSKSPVKTQTGPLKAVHGVKKTDEEKTQLVESSQSQTTITSAQRGSLGRNFPSDSQLHKGSTVKRFPAAKGVNGIVRQSLGSISGLNSVGGSEGSGSGYTSPSIGGARNSLGSGGSDSLRSGSLHSPAIMGSEYIPTFSSDFIPMREFDEIPINAGKIAPGFRKAFGMEDTGSHHKNNRPLSPIIGGYTSESTSNKGRTVSSSATTTNTNVKRSASKSGAKSVERTTSTSSNKSSKKKYNNSSSELEPIDQGGEYFSTERLSSPPVPALMKKLQMGFHTDESGRLSSLPRDILSPLPPLTIGTPVPSISDMRISSSVPKLDIDIAVTPSSNEDLQRLLETVREQVRLSSRGGVTTSSSESPADEIYDQVELRNELQAYEQNERSLKQRQQEETQEDEQDETQDDEEDGDGYEEESTSPREEDNLHEPERFKLPGILPDPFPPIEILTSRTLESEVSFNLQEEFINTLMSQKEVQEQLTAREKELCEKGIIEFNVRLPSRWAHRKNPLRCNSTSKILDDYKDPLASERRRNTASWLRNADDGPATESILNNLTSLRQLSTSYTMKRGE